MEQVIVFTIVGAVLYVASDRLLDWIERRRGARFERRSLVFFAVIFVLAVTSFQLLGRAFG